MRIAVIMSTYNGERYISQQINSIFNQANVEVELFIRDDGSTDNTAKIIHSFAGKKNVHINIGRNIGYAQSFIQELLQHEGFDYYAFSDQDDYWEPEKLFAACEFIRVRHLQDVPVVYYSNLLISDENLSVYKKTKLECRRHTLESVIMRRSIAGCTIVFNKNMWIKVAGKKITEEMLGLGHDSFIISLCYSIGGAVLCDSNAYIVYRQHGNNTSGGTPGLRKRIIKEWNALVKQKGMERRIAAAILHNWSDEVSEQAKATLSTIASMNTVPSKVRVLFSPSYVTGDLLLTVFAKLKVLTGII